VGFVLSWTGEKIAGIIFMVWNAGVWLYALFLFRERDRITQMENRQSSEIKIYPNPMTGNSILQIYPPAAGSANITVFDMTGKRVAQIYNFLENDL